MVGRCLLSCVPDGGWRVLRDDGDGLGGLASGVEWTIRVHTGLLPQEAGELCAAFSRDPSPQPTPFWRGPASPTHGKSSPPGFFRKKCRGRKIDLHPKEKSLFFQAEKH